MYLYIIFRFSLPPFHLHPTAKKATMRKNGNKNEENVSGEYTPSLFLPRLHVGKLLSSIFFSYFPSWMEWKRAAYKNLYKMESCIRKVVKDPCSRIPELVK